MAKKVNKPEVTTSKKPVSTKKKAAPKAAPKAKTPVKATVKAKAKTITKVTAKATVKKEIAVKSVGQNVLVVINNEKYSKRVPKKEDREAIIESVRKYNIKNTLKTEKELLKLFASEAKSTAIKEKVARKSVGTKQVPVKPKTAKAIVAKEVVEKAKTEKALEKPASIGRRSNGEW